MSSNGQKKNLLFGKEGRYVTVKREPVSSRVHATSRDSRVTVATRAKHFTNGGTFYGNTISFPGFAAHLKLDGQPLCFAKAQSRVINPSITGRHQKGLLVANCLETGNIRAENATGRFKISSPAQRNIAFCLQLASENKLAPREANCQLLSF